MQSITKNQKKFAITLYLDHFEEVSFLYEQRLTLLDDPEITWLDLEDFENRFEAHIDGLLVGEDLALEVCKQQVIEGDFGELHAAIRVFCRQNRLDLVQEVLEELDAEDEERVQAVSDALNHELPVNWQNEFIRMLSEGDQKLVPIVARLIGYQRLPAKRELFHVALRPKSSDSLPVLFWAIGRVRDPNAIDLLLNYVQHKDEAICSVAALAALRIGEPQTINECLRYAETENWPLLPLGLGGGSSAISVLLRIASGGNVSVDCLISLGLLGDISAMDTLLYHIGNTELAESAALAMNLITGAALYEEVFIPEDIDEDELFEEELEKLKKGESLYPPGEESGTTITRVSQKPEDWHDWWTENKSRFSPGIRYRNGKPYSPACLLENLKSEKSIRQVRQFAYEELVIRYDIDFPFETDMFVVQRKQAIAKYAEWIEANSSRFQAGQWYFSGRLIS
ncbi:Uncharacterized protein dnm_018360 [Desulfonema magnum]|uniref:TIGR02270 family protein n=2 Tax=Desulfonema magnum TaxID=45655 RepID=A0A975BI57_9BACT|nr:Uncharacterized protein dnm_018360 [Desulfonema magnum]